METRRIDSDPEAARSPLETPKHADEGAVPLRIRLLGELDLLLGDVQLAPLGSARAESLLAFLLLHRDAPQPRGRVAFLLWPDSTESQARTNLRHLLHTLRRALPEIERFVDVRQRTLQWRGDAPFWLDVAAFEQAVAENRLEDAVELYAGDLLESSYDDWLLEQRERLAQLYVDVLTRLVQRLEEERRHAQAIHHAELLQRRDPLREDTYRSLMRLHAAAGDRARALRAYHACEAVLQRELGVAPTPATRQAYEALLPDAPDERAGEAPADGPTRPPLVGRAAERARLTELWRAAERGRAQLVLVTGEPGIGKSRLVEELHSWCAHRGATTAEARAYAMEGALAYGGVVAWLRSEQIAPRARRLDRQTLAELARILPELAVEVPDLATPGALPESEQRQRLFEGAAQAILAAGAPVLLVADDLQWFDAQSLRFVHFLLRSEAEAPVLVAATARREDLGPGHAAEELVAALQALGRSFEIQLERFGPEETAILAERVAGRSLTDAEAARLYSESEGNPLFVVEALRAGPDAGGPLGGSRAEAVIASRLAQLSEPAAELVGVAATVGREFTTRVLADASEADERAFVRGLDELWRRGLVRAQGPGAYDFSHARIREAAYEALGPAQAQHHHLQVARALQVASPAELESSSGIVAAHYDRAGAAAEAVDWYARAAGASQRLYAHADAVRALERALELIPRLPQGPDRDTLELEVLTALPAPLVSIEGYLSSRLDSAHARALELAASLDASPDPRLARSIALAYLSRGAFEEARPFGEQLRSRADADGDDVLWVESAYVLGITAYWQGELEAARDQFEAAIVRYRPEQRAAHLVRYGQDPRVVCLMRLAHTLWLLGRTEDSARAREESFTWARELGHPYSRSNALVFAALIALDSGDEDAFRRHVREIETDPGAQDNRPTRSGVEALAGYVEVLDGRAREGTARVHRALDEARRGGLAAPGHLGLLARLHVQAHATTGAAETGLEAANEALGLGNGAALWEAEIRRLRAGFLASVGAARDEVEAELLRAVETAERQGARSFALRAHEDLTRIGTGTP